MIANLEEKIGPTERINRGLRVIRFTIHTGRKVSPFERHHGKKPTTKLANKIKGNKSYISNWTTLNVSLPPKQIPKNVARNGKGVVSDLMIVARNRKTPCCASQRSPKRRLAKPVSENF